MPSHDLPAPLTATGARTASRLLALALALGGAIPATVVAQVIYFQRPPTVEQLREALLPPGARAPAVPAAGETGDLPAGTRTRGIVITPAATPAETPAVRQGAAPSPAATAILAGRATAPAPAPVGDRAAALPINFDLGSSRVDRGSLPYIEQVAALMRDDPGLRLVIEGHTDDRGSFSRNMVLSWDRAIGVYRSLVENYGVDPTRLQPLGKGPLEPLPGIDPHDGSNRRVQFRVTG